MFLSTIRAGLAVLAVTGMALTGCARDTQPAPPKPINGTPSQLSLKFSAKNNTYSPLMVEAMAGRKYRAEVSDITEEHTFSISAFDVNVLLSGPGNQVFDLEVPAAARGDIPFFCSLHVGMAGTLRILP